MGRISQRLLVSVAVLASAVALYNQQIAAGIVAAGALVAWAIVTVLVRPRTD